MTPPSSRREDTARVAAACVLALATALAVILVVTGGDSQASPSAFGGDSRRSAGSGGDTDFPSTGGSTSGSSGGGGTEAAPDNPITSTREQLEANFPFPPRSRPISGGDRILPPGYTQQVRIVRADLATMRSFYERELAEIGLESSYLESTQGGKLVAWTIPYHTPDYRLSGTVDLQDNFAGDTPGKITIEVTFQ